MKSPIRFGRRDSTHADIVKGLRKCGYKVHLLDTFDALVCGPDGRLTMMDFKSPRGKPTKSQQDMVDAGWPLRFASSVEEALEIVGSRDPVAALRRAGL